MKVDNDRATSFYHTFPFRERASATFSLKKYELLVNGRGSLYNILRSDREQLRSAHNLKPAGNEAYTAMQKEITNV